MQTLFIANKNYSSWSLRPWVLMRVLGIPFEERLIPFGSGDTPNPFKAFSPTGKVPCLVDGHCVVWDSLAIIEYLAERSSLVWPKEPSARAWARSATAEMHSSFQVLRDICGMNCGIRVLIDTWPPVLLTELARLDSLWSDGFTRFGGPFLAGEAFTAVDAFFAPVAFRVQTYAPRLAEASRRYADRLLALPAMQDWYGAALLETWREKSHDEEARRVGLWTDDFRRR